MAPAGEGPNKGDRYSFSYSAEEANQPASAIVAAVSWVKGTDVVGLEPLADVVDPDALNALFGRQVEGGMFDRMASCPTPENLQVVFEYAGYVVTVDSDLITVRPK